MKSLMLLSFQALLIALLCSSALTENRATTLDELIKSLGSLYQKKLFSFRDNEEETEHLRGQLVRDQVPIVLRETVPIPRYHACMSSIPYCVTFYGSIIVQDKPDLPERNIRNDGDQLCLKDIELGPCSDIDQVAGDSEIIDVTGLKIHDFCFPGTVELSGNLGVLEQITANTSIHVQMDPKVDLPTPNRNRNNILPGKCSQVGYFYNVCEMMEREDDCPQKWNVYDVPNFPCSCPVDPMSYEMDGFKKMVNTIDFFGLGEKSGFAVVSGKERKSCFSFKFTGTIGTS